MSEVAEYFAKIAIIGLMAKNSAFSRRFLRFFPARFPVFFPVSRVYVKKILHIKKIALYLHSVSENETLKVP